MHSNKPLRHKLNPRPIITPAFIYKKHWASELSLILVGLFVILPLFIAWINITSSFISVRDNRIEVRDVFLFGETKTIFFKDVRSVRFQETWLGNIFGYQDIEITDTLGRVHRITGIANTKHLKTMLTAKVKQVF